jgi:hypothetical protein
LPPASCPPTSCVFLAPNNPARSLCTTFTRDTMDLILPALLPQYPSGEYWTNSISCTFQTSAALRFPLLAPPPSPSAPASSSAAAYAYTRSACVGGVGGDACGRDDAASCECPINSFTASDPWPLLPVTMAICPVARERTVQPT